MIGGGTTAIPGSALTAPRILLLVPARTYRAADLLLAAARMGLDMSKDRSLWRDQAMVELNVAVLHSFDAAGVTITDPARQAFAVGQVAKVVAG